MKVSTATMMSDFTAGFRTGAAANLVSHLDAERARSFEAVFMRTVVEEILTQEAIPSERERICLFATGRTSTNTDRNDRHVMSISAAHSVMMEATNPLSPECLLTVAQKLATPFYKKDADGRLSAAADMAIDDLLADLGRRLSGAAEYQDIFATATELSVVAHRGEPFARRLAALVAPYALASVLGHRTPCISATQTILSGDIDGLVPAIDQSASRSLDLARSLDRLMNTLDLRLGQNQQSSAKTRVATRLFIRYPIMPTTFLGTYLEISKAGLKYVVDQLIDKGVVEIFGHATKINRVFVCRESLQCD